MYKFMQIYGNCAGTKFLGENRIKGPVDNVNTKNKKIIELLYNDSYLKYIQTAVFKQTKRDPSFKGDSSIEYSTDLVSILHGNPLTIKYIENLKVRCDALKDFLKEINTNQEYYLIYTLNIYDVDFKRNKLNTQNILDNIECLRKLNLLSKTIFVGTKWIPGGDKMWNFWSNDFIPLIKKYNLKYIEIEGLKGKSKTSIENLKKWNNDFINQFKNCLKNGTDKKYLEKR